MNASSNSLLYESMNDVGFSANTRTCEEPFVLMQYYHPNLWSFHLPQMSLRHHVAFVSIFISAGLLAQLTIPSQLCQTLGFNSVADCLWGQKATRLISCLAHCFRIIIGPGWAGSGAAEIAIQNVPYCASVF